MKKKLLALLMGSALVLSACGGGGDKAEEPAQGGDQAVAEGLYAKSCSGCHGQNLEGSMGTDLTTVGARLNASEIEGIIVNGQAAMPAAILQGDDAKVVAEWLASKK